jgi:hypothetical protein
MAAGHNLALPFYRSAEQRPERVVLQVARADLGRYPAKHDAARSQRTAS